jgi:2',3'-cyclic-nucleotide 2'-phosphodiesterase (5'-nucleotidase family)
MSVRILRYSDIENATDDPQRIGRLTRCLREHRDDRTLVCGTGDTTSPGLLSLQDVTESPVAEDVAASYRALFAELGLEETLTRLEKPIARGRTDRYSETPIGNVVVDSIRWAADADVAVVHPLMLRSGPPLDGEVSVGDVRSTTPFDNDLHSARLDGDELVALFESLVSPEFLELDAEVYGHVSGATLSWRRDDDGLELVEATVDGERPDASETYTVVAPTLEFVGDGLYPALMADRIEADHGSQHDALVGYARKHGIDPEPDGRMRVVSDTASGEFRSLR